MRVFGALLQRLRFVNCFSSQPVFESNTGTYARVTAPMLYLNRSSHVLCR